MCGLRACNVYHLPTVIAYKPDIIVTSTLLYYDIDQSPEYIHTVKISRDDYGIQYI